MDNEISIKQCICCWYDLLVMEDLLLIQNGI